MPASLIQEGDAGFVLLDLIKSCLRSQAEERPTASQIKDSLHLVMQQNKWSDDLTEP